MAYIQFKTMNGLKNLLHKTSQRIDMDAFKAEYETWEAKCKDVKEKREKRYFCDLSGY